MILRHLGIKVKRERIFQDNVFINPGIQLRFSEKVIILCPGYLHYFRLRYSKSMRITMSIKMCFDW